MIFTPPPEQIEPLLKERIVEYEDGTFGIEFKCREKGRWIGGRKRFESLKEARSAVQSNRVKRVVEEFE